MSVYEALQRLRAFDSGVAQARRSLRHVHVADEPFVVVYLQMAGEPFTLWGVMCGRYRDRPSFMHVGDPRNRDDQTRLFEQFAHVLNVAVERSWIEDDQPVQMWVTNSTAANNLRRLGRVMRARDTSAEISLAGSHLDLYSQAASTPGSSMCIAATSALSKQKVTGQSPLEDANLAAQLVWWRRAALADIAPDAADGWDDLTTFQLAARAERFPMGTLTNPEIDEKLQPLVDQLTDDRRNDREPSEEVVRSIGIELRGQLEPMWRALWCAYDEMAGISSAPSVAAGWMEDARVFGLHWQWMAGGGHSRFTDSPMRAAQLLSRWEKDHAGRERNELIEDDMALTLAVLDGIAVVGEITKTQPDRKVGTSKRPTIWLQVARTDINIGTTLWWRANPKMGGEVIAVEFQEGGVTIVIEINKAVKSALPTIGSIEAFIAVDPPFGGFLRTPPNVPWTHTRHQLEDFDNAD